VRSTCRAAVVLAGLAAGCSEVMSELMTTELFKLHTWTEVPAGQSEVKAKVGDVLRLPLGPGSAQSQLGWMRVTVNWKPVEHPDYVPGEETSSLDFHAQKPGVFRVEVRRAVVPRIGVQDPDAAEDEKSSQDQPAAETPSSPNADPIWTPRVWMITVSK
jgi:hypothetical protein